jgi:hypothetical protein
MLINCTKQPTEQIIRSCTGVCFLFLTCYFSQGTHGDLSPQDRQILEAEFCLRHNRHTVPLLDRLLEKKAQGGVDGPSLRIFSEEFLAGIEEPEYLKI